VWETAYTTINTGHWCPKCAGRMPYTINEMHKVAAKRGGKCLSKTYVRMDSHLKWKCAKGHVWETPYASIKRGRWCLKCAGRMRHTIEKMHEVAAKRGGKCLGKTYVRMDSRLKWKCARGHVWEGTYANIKQGSWCPKCAGKMRHTIEMMHKVAAKRGGKCLSSKYINSYTHLKWECAENHTWKTTYNSIQQGTWCPTCAGKKVRNK